MKKNIGFIDRLIRFLIMDFLMGYYLFGAEIPVWLTQVFLVLSLGLFITVIFGYSPLYHLFKYDTLEKKGE